VFRIPRRRQETVWQEYKRKARALVVHALLFLTVLAAHGIVFVVLKAFAAAGFPMDQIDFYEDVDSISAAAVVVGFAIDMLMKVVAMTRNEREIVQLVFHRSQRVACDALYGF
jgi:hypothetical protein